MTQPNQQYMDTDTVVCVAKSALGISTPNSEMLDDEIRMICRWVADRAPDTIDVDGEKVLMRVGTNAMLFIALTEFPEFYEKFELAQFN